VARRMLLDVLAVGSRLGDRIVEAWAASRLGELHEAAGWSGSAREYLMRALRAWQFVANRQRSEEVRARLQALSGV
jgi:hypothetical protein